MNADRLIRMATNMLMRYGMKRLSKGQKSSPQIKQAQKTLRNVNRIRRL